MRLVIDLGLSKGKIGLSIKYLANLIIKDNHSMVISIFQKADFNGFTKRILNNVTHSQLPTSNPAYNAVIQLVRVTCSFDKAKELFDEMPSSIV